MKNEIGIIFLPYEIVERSEILGSFNNAEISKYLHNKIEIGEDMFCSFTIESK